MDTLCNPWSAAASHAAADSTTLGEANGLAAAAFANPDNNVDEAEGNGETKDGQVPAKTVESEVKPVKQHGSTHHGAESSKLGDVGKHSPKFVTHKQSQKLAAGDN